MTLSRADLPITTPCGADWSQMTAVDARARLCVECNKSVHDLSAMNEAEVRAVTRSSPSCVRYLYDVHGRVLLGGAPSGAQVVPASALLSKAARNRWLAAAALAATSIVFEACGGADGGAGGASYGSDAGSGAFTPSPATPRSPSMPIVGDAAASDAGDVDAGDADPDASEDPDAGP